MGNVGGTLGGVVKETGNIGTKMMNTVNNPVLPSDYMVIFGACAIVSIIFIIVGLFNIRETPKGRDGKQLTNCDLVPSDFSRAGKAAPGQPGMCYMEYKNQQTNEWVYRDAFGLSIGIQWLILVGICLVVCSILWGALWRFFWTYRNPVGAAGDWLVYQQ